MFIELTAEERITKAKVLLQDKQPFFAYLLLKLKFQEDTHGFLPRFAGIGARPDNTIFWKNEFVLHLSDTELEGVLVHEVLHLALQHLTRVGNRSHSRWNIACDIIVNNIIVQNNMSLPKTVYLPVNNSIKISDKVITNLDEKTAETLYDLLPECPEDCFDYHCFGDGDDWKDDLMSAYVHSIEKLPKGMDKIIDSLKSPKIGWKHVLRRYVSNYLNYDFSFSKPNKKFREMLMPGLLKENIELVVHVDVSGSISDEDYAQFMAEVRSIALSHRNIKITLIQADTEIVDVCEMIRFTDMNRKGSGGTSHRKVVDYVLKNKPHTRLFVTLTDGWSDIQDCFHLLRCDKLIVLTSDRKELEKYGRVVKL